MLTSKLKRSNRAAIVGFTTNVGSNIHPDVWRSTLHCGDVLVCFVFRVLIRFYWGTTREIRMAVCVPDDVKFAVPPSPRLAAEGRRADWALSVIKHPKHNRINKHVQQYQQKFKGFHADDVSRAWFSILLRTARSAVKTHVLNMPCIDSDSVLAH